MKLLHTSDWHLGAAHRSRSMEPDQQHFIRRILEIIRQEHVDAVALCGDVFDRSIPNAEAVKLYNSAVNDICIKAGVPLLLVAGNHDSPARLATYDGLVRKAGLFVAGELTADLSPVELGNADFYLLPWFSTERARAAFPDAEIDSLQAAYELVLDRIRAAFRPGRRHIVLAHAFVVDAEPSTSDRAAEVGRAAAVSRDVFRGFDYAALGHIHGPQDIGKNIRYCGTPMAYSFGKEEAQQKSVTILDTETMERTIIPIEPLHPRLTLRGTLEELLHPALTPKEQEGYIRCEVTDCLLTLDVQARLRELYPNLLECAGKAWGREDGTITMTPEDLEQKAADPMEVFCSFCADNMQQPPDEHLMNLFARAVAEYERSVAE